jgi:hypothetical protein
VAFLQAALTMLAAELDSLERPAGRPRPAGAKGRREASGGEFPPAGVA